MDMKTSIKDHTFVVIDVATTGFRAEIDEPVEVAAVKMRNGKILGHKVWRFDPSVSIPPQATAVHEIRNQDVKGCPKIEECEQEIVDFVGDSTIIMHNLVANEPLDWAMLPFLHDKTWICNARLAKHLWPQTTCNEDEHMLMNYDVWTLNYWLKNSNLDTLNAQVYEPLAFAAVTAHVFNVGLKKYLEMGNPSTIEDLLKFTENKINLVLWPMGKFRDSKVSEIDDRSLGRLLVRARGVDEFDEDLLFTLQTEVDRRLKEKNFAAVRRFN